MPRKRGRDARGSYAAAHRPLWMRSRSRFTALQPADVPLVDRPLGLVTDLARGDDADLIGPEEEAAARAGRRAGTGHGGQSRRRADGAGDWGRVPARDRRSRSRSRAARGSGRPREAGRGSGEGTTRIASDVAGAVVPRRVGDAARDASTFGHVIESLGDSSRPATRCHVDDLLRDECPFLDRSNRAGLARSRGGRGASASSQSRTGNSPGRRGRNRRGCASPQLDGQRSAKRRGRRERSNSLVPAWSARTCRQTRGSQSPPPPRASDRLEEGPCLVPGALARSPARSERRARRGSPIAPEPKPRPLWREPSPGRASIRAGTAHRSPPAAAASTVSHPPASPARGPVPRPARRPRRPTAKAAADRGRRISPAEQRPGRAPRQPGRNRPRRADRRTKAPGRPRGSQSTSFARKRRQQGRTS